MARPTKLTKKVEAAIVQSVRNGNYSEVAARAAGISPTTMRNWRARGEEGGAKNAPYVRFLAALTRAEAEAEERAVKALGDAFSEDWRAAVEYLKRKNPERWSATERLEHTGAGGGPIKHERNVDVSKLSPEALDEIERAASS